MNFGMVILNQSINILQNYAAWIQAALSFILPTKMLMKTLPMMLKKDLTHQVMQSKDHCLQGKNKKVINDR